MPAILESCVTKVKSEILAKAAKKRGINKQALSDEVRKQAESRAYAICTSTLKKAGKI